MVSSRGSYPRATQVRFLVLQMDTKLKGDIAEQVVILEALKKGISVSIPVGDRLPYDLIFDIENILYKIQVKYAWLDKKYGNYLVDSRTAKTNRAIYKYVKYNDTDFDFAIMVIVKHDIFYIMPSNIFNSYRSSITLVNPDNKSRQRSPRSYEFKNAWHLLT